MAQYAFDRKMAQYAFDRAMKDADWGDTAFRKGEHSRDYRLESRMDAQISGCTTVLARDLDPGTRSDILRKRGDGYYGNFGHGELTIKRRQRYWTWRSRITTRRYVLIQIMLLRITDAPTCILMNLMTTKLIRRSVKKKIFADYSQVIGLADYIRPKFAAFAFYQRALLWGDENRENYFKRY